jgi:hypothetical protein
MRSPQSEHACHPVHLRTGSMRRELASLGPSKLDNMDVECRRALELVQPGASAASIEDLAHNRWLTAGIWADSSNGLHMVLKCLTPDREPPGSAWDAHWTKGAEDQRRWNYWAREGLAYRHRLVKVYEPGGIVGPELLAAHYADDLIVLLLEHVEGLPGDSGGSPITRRRPDALVEPRDTCSAASPYRVTAGSARASWDSTALRSQSTGAYSTATRPGTSPWSSTTFPPSCVKQPCRFTQRGIASTRSCPRSRGC